MEVGPPFPARQPAPFPLAAPARSSPWAVVAAVAAGCWAVGFVLVGQLGGWLTDQIMLASGLDRVVWLWPATVLFTVLLVGAPALALALLPRSAAVRATGRAWLAAALVLGALGLLRAVPPVHHEAYLAALAAAAALAALVLRAVARRSQDGRPARATAPTVTLLGAAGGLALLLPWVWLGALGGLLETVLAGLAAAALGALAGELLDDAFWTRFTLGEPPRPARLVLVGGLVAGVALLLLAAGVGQSGAQLPLLLTLPPAGFALAALHAAARRPAAATPAGPPGTAHGGPPGTTPHAGPPGTSHAGPPDATPHAGAPGTAHGGPPDATHAAPWGTPHAGPPDATHAGAPGTAGPGGGRAATRWLVGLAVFGPLAFTDPEEITLVLAATRDVPFWVAAAAGAGLAVAAVLAVAYGVLLARPRSRRPSRRVAAVTAVALLVAVGVVAVGAGQPGLHGERLFVVLREQADLSGVPAATGRAGRDARAGEVYRRLVDTAERTQAGLRRDLRRLRLDHTPYYLVNAVEVDGGPAVRAWLSRRPEVARVLVSQRVRPLPAPAGRSRGTAPAPAGPEWNIRMIGADRVWSQLGVDGSGVVVGSSDSGVDGGHPALAGGFRGGDDSWYDPWDGTRSPTDQGGHGTHTVGSAVGRGGIGVAPGAQWVGCVNLDRNLGSPGYYLDCLQFMLAPFPTGGDPFTDGRPARAPDILTNSWGCPAIEGCDPRALRPATAALDAAGILMVAAAGNTGPYCGSIDDPPAPYEDVLTVGAVDRQRRVTSFSSRGPVPGAAKPDLVAPGDEVLSAMPGGGYDSLSGTSMATPQVAGVVALMWSANPALVGDLPRTRQILRDTVTRAEATYASRADTCGGDANITGAGLVDAYAAVRAARG
ncbi:Subtilase family protein [Micromonospora citrea]|uniref:Subtilase family protein n=1 Tax=Micromonospora citrea TaxID=47855 RepID=A0A1C6VA02_9ACTN|nr:S8 family serine peptidase [Micromonospora citrea]SCL63159.1 Subtilase family protein [Micromonospora citrea]